MFDTIIVKPIFNALLLLYSIVPGGDFGVAIIIFTIIIRFLMYPLVKRQLHQTKMMRKLQPELAKIKKAANGNKQLEGMQQMELYKRFGVSPFRSILILIVQLPIFIGLYQVIQIMALHRDQMVHYVYEPLKHIPAIAQIIDNPNNFNHLLLGFIDITKTAFSNHGIDIVLLLLAGTARASYAQRHSRAPCETDAVRRHVCAVDDSLGRALVRADTVALARLYADDLVSVNYRGMRSTKPALIAAIAAGRLRFDTLRARDRTVEVYGDTAVLRELMHQVATGAEGRHPSEVDYRRTYVRRHQRWQLAAAAIGIAPVTASVKHEGTDQSPASAVTFVSAAEIKAAVEQNNTDAFSDSPLRTVPIQAKYNVGVAVVRRTKVDGRMLPDALIHNDVAEVYQIIEGEGVLVTDGVLESAKPLTAAAVVGEIGPSSAGQSIVGGISRRVGPGDIVIIPPHTPHGFVEITTPRIVYTIIRIDPQRVLELRSKPQ